MTGCLGVDRNKVASGCQDNRPEVQVRDSLKTRRVLVYVWLRPRRLVGVSVSCR